MKIAFLWTWKQAKETYPAWRDGLRGAMEEIAKTYEVDWYFGEECNSVEDKYDYLLYWTDSNEPLFSKYSSYKGKKGICLTTDPHNIENLRYMDVIFCESTPVYEAVRRHGLHGALAFGTDTDFFTPDSTVKKDLEYFYPATFSPWKLQSDIAYLGDRLTCIGTIQPDGEGELAKCREQQVNVEIGYFPVEKIRDYYNRTQKMIIPAFHGSERTVLEAMSMNILPEVTNPLNVRTRSYIEEYKKSGCQTPREFVLKNYSHQKYAADIMKGLI